MIATLRAAAPWQKIRLSSGQGTRSIIVRPDDIHVHRYEDRTDRLVVFLVDASGSAIMNRMAEAKSAVELMLADTYANGDHVALVAFRGT